MTHEHHSQFPVILREVYQTLQEDLGHKTPERGVVIDSNGLRFLGVYADLRDCFDIKLFREQIGDLLGFSDFRIVQVVGDSSQGFTPAGLDKAKYVVNSQVYAEESDTSKTVLEYGYTASKNDANWVVNEIVATTPDLRMRTIANVVYMSAIVIESWGCEATRLVNNFVLAYDKTETSFGSDIWLSDNVMSASHGDKMICLEGGPQTFSQAAGVVLRGVPVLAVTGLRMQGAADTVSARFSASKMLDVLCKEVQRCTNNGILPPNAEAQVKLATLTHLEGFGELQGPDNITKRNMVLRSLEALIQNLKALDVVELDHVP